MVYYCEIDFQVMINKHMPVVHNEGENEVINPRNVEYRDVSVVLRQPLPYYAERVLLTYNDDDAHLIKVLLRQTRYFPNFFIFMCPL